jgi:hypothetical protein
MEFNGMQEYGAHSRWKKPLLWGVMSKSKPRVIDLVTLNLTEKALNVLV